MLLWWTETKTNRSQSEDDVTVCRQVTIQCLGDMFSRVVTGPAGAVRCRAVPWMIMWIGVGWHTLSSTSGDRECGWDGMGWEGFC
mmetsp:Transcript_19258/g.19574  ORF Transcript_19258/g.19574 Transcript_19258/m.19574 type:complete len:85 (-) Transcript_19258:22-276(-)